MRKLCCLAYVVGGLMMLWAATADAAPKRGLLLTRTSANHYYDHTHDRTYATRDCTQTAHLMTAYLDTMGSKRFLVFVGADGEDEGECQIR